MEEKLESQKKTFSETEDKLTQQIKHLEKKLQYEKEAKLKFLSQLEEDIDSESKVNCIQQKPCKKCTILEEETKQMLVYKDLRICNKGS